MITYMIFLLILTLVGYEGTPIDVQTPIYNQENITWYTLPYNIPEKPGKDWTNVEVWDSKHEIVWPYSVALDGIRSSFPFPHVRLFCYKGRCCIWFDSHTIGIKSCMIYTATEDVTWLRLQSRVITNDRGRETDFVDAVEITKEEFCAHILDRTRGVRYLELKGPQVIVGACGHLRGYNLKELDLKEMAHRGRQDLLDALRQIDMKIQK